MSDSDGGHSSTQISCGVTQEKREDPVPRCGRFAAGGVTGGVLS